MMTNIQEKEDNILPFEQPKPKPDGKGPKGEDWLSSMKIGTIFLYYPKSMGNNPSVFIEAMYGGNTYNHHETEAHMVINDPDNRAIFQWVDPLSWCSQCALKEILLVPEDEE